MTTITFPKRSQFGRNNLHREAIEQFQQWLKENVPNFLECFMLYNTDTTIYFESRMNRNGKVLILRAKEYNLDEKFIQHLNKLIEQDHKLTKIKTENSRILHSNLDTAVFLQECFPVYKIKFSWSGYFTVSTEKVYVQIASDSKVHTPKAEVNQTCIYSRMSVNALVQLAKEVEVETEKLMGHLPEIMALIPKDFWKA